MKSRPGFAIPSDDWKTVSVNPAVNRYFVFESGKEQAAKGEGWAPLYTSCAQDTVGLPTAIRLY